MRARVFLVLFLAVLVVPGAASAKGPDQATVDGAGMADPHGAVAGSHENSAVSTAHDPARSTVIAGAERPSVRVKDRDRKPAEEGVHPR